MKIGMGIIKVEISLPEAAKALEEFRREPKRTFELISNEIRTAVSSLFDQLLQTEMSIFLGFCHLLTELFRIPLHFSLIFPAPSLNFHATTILTEGGIRISYPKLGTYVRL